MQHNFIKKSYNKDGSETLHIVTYGSDELKEAFSPLELAELATDGLVEREYPKQWTTKIVYASVRSAAKAMNM